MTEPNYDRPFAIWRVFHDAPRWWFAQGCPPPLRDERFHVRLLRFVVLLGCMGVGTAIVGGAFCLVSANFDVSGHVLSNVQPLVLGAFFGIGVLAPTSRWLGRGWDATCLAIPVSVASQMLSLHLAWVIEDRVMNADGVWDTRWTDLILVIGSGLPMAIWMCDWRRPLLAPLVAVVCAGLLFTGISHLITLAIYRLFQGPFAPSPFWELSQFNSHLTQTVLLALAVTSHLLWCADCRCGEPSREATQA